MGKNWPKDLRGRNTDYLACRALGALDERKILKLCVVVVKVKNSGGHARLDRWTKPGVGERGACQQRVFLFQSSGCRRRQPMHVPGLSDLGRKSSHRARGTHHNWVGQLRVWVGAHLARHASW